MADFGNQHQPASSAEKSQVAREVMGLSEGKESAHPHAPRFHSMHIASAENGSMVEHLHKSNPTGPDKPKKVVISHDHPMNKHVQALHEYCTSCTGE